MALPFKGGKMGGRVLVQEYESGFVVMDGERIHYNGLVIYLMKVL
jgi:hypothetical protein